MKSAELSMPPCDLDKFLLIDAETGTLTWKRRDVSTFSNEKRWSAESICAAWNSRYAGKPAFTSKHINGYLTGRINYKALLTHRVVFAMHTGRWPLNGIDHINGDKTDNRITNLREASHKVNAMNMKIPKTNATGVLGVSFDAVRGKYYACISVNGKTKSLGRFAFIEDAAAARANANIKFGYHNNHGRAV